MRENERPSLLTSCESEKVSISILSSPLLSREISFENANVFSFSESVREGKGTRETGPFSDSSFPSSLFSKGKDKVIDFVSSFPSPAPSSSFFSPFSSSCECFRELV